MANGNNKSSDELFESMYGIYGDGGGASALDYEVQRQRTEEKKRSDEVVAAARKENRGCECGVDSLERKEDRAPNFHSSWCPVSRRGY